MVGSRGNGDSSRGRSIQSLMVAGSQGLWPWAGGALIALLSLPSIALRGLRWRMRKGFSAPPLRRVHQCHAVAGDDAAVFDDESAGWAGDDGVGDGGAREDQEVGGAAGG